MSQDTASPQSTTNPLDSNTKTLRILAPNRHNIYFMILSQTGHQIDILTDMPGSTMPWGMPASELPANIKLISWSPELAKNIHQGAYDAIVILTLKDLWQMRRFRGTPIIFMIHIALYHHTLKLKVRWCIKRALLGFLRLSLPRLTVAFSSPAKKATWLLKDAPVIKHPPLPTPPCHFRESPQACTVGNHLNSREEVDFALLQRLRRDVPIHVIGRNPGVADCTTPTSRTAFLETLQQYQIFVFILRHPWEDGFNLAVLEAMQSGLAVVSMAHPTTLIKDGVNGFLCYNENEMARRIQELLNNPNLCQRLGKAAQKTVKEQFSTKVFCGKWRQLLAQAVTSPARDQISSNKSTI